MIDMHCHLLPEIDDGPRNMRIAVEMARLSLRNGIEKAVLTPHIIPNRYDNNLKSISNSFEQYAEELVKQDIGLQLSMAAEVRLDPLIIEMVETQSLPFLGELDGIKIMLLEFPHQGIPPGAIETVNWLKNKSIRTVIAHPERNRGVMNDINKIKPFVDAGALLQMTAGALTGVFGQKSLTTARKLLKKGLISLIATDAHNISTRPPELEPGRRVAEKIVGESTSWSMVRELPSQIVGSPS